MKRNIYIFWPLYLILFLIPVSGSLDLTISHFFFDGEHFSKHPFFLWFYHWGTLFAWAVAGVALLGIWIKHWRKASLFYLFAFAIGPGLLVNGVFKELWQRPRPVQTVDFGGFAPFHPFFEPLWPHLAISCKSFPSGHASMGFIFIALFWIGQRENSRLLKALGILGAIVLGFLLSWTRLAMGGHYFTDILGAFVIVWLTCALVDCYIYERPFWPLSKWL